MLWREIRESSLALLEEGRCELLPARVFVVGWIAAYARVVGCDAAVAIARWPAAPATTDLSARIDQTKARLPDGHELLAERRRLSMGLVVIVLLAVAALTLSVALGHGGAIAGLPS